MLFGWVVREGWKLMYVDLDIGQGLIIIFGIVVVMFVEMFIYFIEGVLFDLFLVYFYGYIILRCFFLYN